MVFIQRRRNSVFTSRLTRVPHERSQEVHLHPGRWRASGLQAPLVTDEDGFDGRRVPVFDRLLTEFVETEHQSLGARLIRELLRRDAAQAVLQMSLVWEIPVPESVDACLRKRTYTEIVGGLALVQDIDRELVVRRIRSSDTHSDLCRCGVRELCIQCESH